MSEYGKKVLGPICLIETGPGKPVEYEYGLLWLIYVLLRGLAAYCFRLLGVPGVQDWAGRTLRKKWDPSILLSLEENLGQAARQASACTTTENHRYLGALRS